MNRVSESCACGTCQEEPGHRSARLWACISSGLLSPIVSTWACTCLRSTRAVVSLEWFSSYLSGTCLLKTEGKDFIFLLDLVPSFLCVLRKIPPLHLQLQGPQERGGGRISLPRSQYFCLTLELMLAKFSLLVSLLFCLHFGLSGLLGIHPWRRKTLRIQILHSFWRPFEPNKLLD